MPTTIEVSALYCAGTGLEPGEDGATHHLQPRAAGMTCATCHRTEDDIRHAAMHAPVAHGRDAEGSPLWYSCPQCEADVHRLDAGDRGPTDLFHCTECGWSYEA